MISYDMYPLSSVLRRPFFNYQIIQPMYLRDSVRFEKKIKTGKNLEGRRGEKKKKREGKREEKKRIHISKKRKISLFSFLV